MIFCLTENNVFDNSGCSKLNETPFCNFLSNSILIEDIIFLGCSFMTSFYHFLYKITCQVLFRYDITSRLTKDLGMRIRPRLRNPSKGLERVLLYWTSRHTAEESISFPEPTCPLVSTKTRSSGIIRGSSRVLSIMPN